MNIQGRSFVVSGGTGGIGSEIVRLLVAAGAWVYVLGRDRLALEELEKQYPTAIRTIGVDFLDKESLFRAISIITTATPFLDGLIHAAGVGVYKTIPTLSIQEWESSLAIGLTGPFILTKGLLPLLQRTEHSKVISLGSGAGIYPMKERSSYCATKFGLRGWSLSLSTEFAAVSPQFCVVELGSTMTDFGPLDLDEKEALQKDGKRYFAPAEAAAKIYELLLLDTIKPEVEFYPEHYLEDIKRNVPDLAVTDKS